MDETRPARRRTQDERLLAGPTERAAFRETDTWRVLRIMGEFVDGFEELAGRGDEAYATAVEVGRLLGDAGKLGQQ